MNRYTATQNVRRSGVGRSCGCGCRGVGQDEPIDPGVQALALLTIGVIVGGYVLIKVLKPEGAL